MRKVILGVNISLDGYMAGPNGEMDWLFRTTDPAQLQAVTASLREIDTILLGRVGYLEQAASWPNQSSEMAELLNSRAKVVFSKTLTTLEWNNSRLATADPATEIARLKQQPGQNIVALGGARFAQSLVRLRLVDEYGLIVHPIILGGGLPLFKDLAEPLNLKLVNTATYATGAVQFTYVPAHP
ncbi:MAG: Dihydrofolate reductase [Ktedonobacterales bacterium]|nr:MAG: Dihydrofolate reductase [Ktedonobacterales bacterium]